MCALCVPSELCVIISCVLSFQGIIFISPRSPKIFNKLSLLCVLLLPDPQINKPQNTLNTLKLNTKNKSLNKPSREILNFAPENKNIPHFVFIFSHIWHISRLKKLLNLPWSVRNISASNIFAISAVR